MSNVFIKGGDTVEVDADSVSLDGVGDVIRISASTFSFVKAGVGAQSPDGTDLPVRANEVAYLFIGFDADTVAATGNALVTRGSIR